MKKSYRNMLFAVAMPLAGFVGILYLKLSDNALSGGAEASNDFEIDGSVSRSGISGSEGIYGGGIGRSSWREETIVTFLESYLGGMRQAMFDGDTPEAREAIDRALAVMTAENALLFRYLFDGLPEGIEYGYALERFVAAWSKFDPESAVAFAWEAGEDVGFGGEVLRVAMDVWFENEPDRAVEFVKDYPSGRLREEAIEALASSVVTQLGEEAAIEWVETLDSSRFRNFSGQHVGYRMASGDPDLAKAWVESLESGGGYSKYLTRGVAEQLAERDYLAAMHWAEGIERLSIRREAVAASIRRWAEADPVGAAIWISKAEVDLISDSVLSSYIEGAYRDNPDVTLLALAGVRRRQTREELGSMIREYWEEVDPEVYQSVFENSVN